MILLDTDILVDLLRKYAPAIEWFSSFPDDEEIVVPGYVVMELIQGCRDKLEQERVQRELASCGVVWLSSTDCDQALAVFAVYPESQRRTTGRADRPDRSGSGRAATYLQPAAL